jgi:hypothetical protein
MRRPVANQESRAEADYFRVRALYVAAFLLWATCVGSGLARLWDYENGPGVAASAPGTWPENEVIPPPNRRATLVLLIHPQCSCSQATIAELERLQAHVDDEIDTYVLMLSPSGAGRDWVRSPLWRKAAAIRGVTIIADHGGRQAARFGGFTSGQALLYDASARLVFSGGITASRGHEGDNAGRSAIERLARQERADRRSTFVFGCALFAAETSPGRNRP